MNPFSEMFAAALPKKRSPEHLRAQAAAPVLPLLRPPGWGGVAAGVNGRRLLETGLAEPEAPWVTLVAIKAGDDSFIAPPTAQLEKVFARPVAEVEQFAIRRLDDRMRIDPCFVLSQRDGLVLVAWEDFAASLILHDGFTRSLRERFDKPLVVAIPTCATLIAGAVERVDQVRALSRDVLGSLGPASSLTPEVFSLVDGRPRRFEG